MPIAREIRPPIIMFCISLSCSTRIKAIVTNDKISGICPQYVNRTKLVKSAVSGKGVLTTVENSFTF